MRKRPITSFAFDELERYLLRAGANPDTRFANGKPRLLTDCEVARHTGRHRGAVIRLRGTGLVSIVSAERIADHLGVDPSDIWPNYWDVMIERQELADQWRDAYNHSRRTSTRTMAA